METEKNTKSLLESVPKKELRTINYIQTEELRQFSEKALEAYGTEEKLELSNEIADIIIQLLKHKGLIDEHTHQAFVDIMLTSALIHNLFYDKKDWTTLFSARKELECIAEEMRINKQALSAIYHTVEGQLGEKTPVSECIPKPGTPTEVFATAVWFRNSMFFKGKK